MMKQVDGQLTVGELKEKIKDLPDDMTVVTGGCDCIGAAKAVEVFEGSLLVDRMPGQ